ERAICGLDLLPHLVAAANDRLGAVPGDDPLLRQHSCVRDRPGDVVTVEPPVIAYGGGILERPLIETVSSRALDRPFLVGHRAAIITVNFSPTGARERQRRSGAPSAPRWRRSSSRAR